MEVIMRESFRKQSQELFVQVMGQLSAHSNLYEPIQGILEKACEFFGFGCAVIYESDYSRTFHLREHCSVYSNKNLHKSFQMDRILSETEIEELAGTSVLFFYARTLKSKMEQKLAELLGANSMLLVPITGSNAALIGFVGLLDRRNDVNLSDDEVEVACSVLNVLANHAKLRAYQRKIEDSRISLESIMDNMGVDIYVNDFYNHDILYVNRSMAAPYGGYENMMGKKCWQAIYSDKTGQCEYCPQKKLIDADGNPTKVYSWDYQRPFDGSWFRVLSAAFQWVDGRLAHVVSSVDITENKRNEEIIRYMAEIDPLTQLPNRRKLLQDCSERLKHLEKNHKEGYVLFFDLDNFKAVNDSLGHRAGDELLSNVGKVLESSSYTRNRGYRHGGDEFVLLYEDVTAAYIKEAVTHLLETFCRPWLLADGEVSCPVSIGVAHFPNDGDNTEELLHHADLAMYAAKRDGKGIARFYNQDEIDTEHQM